MSNLAKKVLLVGLKIRAKAWTARNGEQTERVARENDASTDAGVYIDRLFPKSVFSALNGRIAELRRFFKANTLRWKFDDGVALVTPDKYQALSDGIDAAKAEIEDEVRKIVGSWAANMVLARESRGKLFDESQYPEDPAELFDLYAVEFSTSELAPGSDLESIFGENAKATAEKIRAEMAKRYDAAQRDAMSDLIEKLSAPVEDMIAKLEQYEADVAAGKAPRIKSGMLGNVRTVVEALQGLNITGDKRVDTMLEDVRKLGAVDEDALRGKTEDAKKARTDVAKKGKRIAGLAAALKGQIG